MTERALKIAYLGNSRFGWCTEVHIARTLTQMGHEVTFLQEDRQTPETVEAAGAEQDLVLFTRTWGLPAPLTDVWRRLEANGTVTASLHLDLYVGLEREATIDNDPFWQTQYVFTADGDPATSEKLAAVGIDHRWSPPAVVRDECVMGRFAWRFAKPVVFVGSAGDSYLKEWPWRKTLQTWLAATYGADYARFGNPDPVRGSTLNDLYASAGVAVGDSLCPGFTKPLYTSDRLFEAGGRGAVQVYPRIPGIEEAFGLVDGEHLFYYDYGDTDLLHDRITWCLDNPEAARAMADRGQAYIRENHTYHNRLAKVLADMGLRNNPEWEEPGA